MDCFTVRLPLDLARRFDAAASACGGRSRLLRRLIEAAAADGDPRARTGAGGAADETLRSFRGVSFLMAAFLMVSRKVAFQKLIHAMSASVWTSTLRESQMNIAIAYILTLATFAVIDTAWLGSMGDRLYRPFIGSMLADNFRLAPAIAFYALYAAGLTIFAVLPGLAEGGWKKALLWGGLFGLFAYGTYDLTNLATLKTWSLKLSLIDMTWGVIVSGGSSAIACALAAKALRLL